ncbi:hypothetical protein RBWH47_04176 [Rhodopirellula baltica WH47]|uniref:Uncharacterized protein n=1 Tax=Rhodopirellula baltica WH47 TaxID=991778 RepID=F2ARZ1_RHOBT|nr:hypothetical protein RBWH47_04176 [Rhodopirellula baltica WH47]
MSVATDDTVRSLQSLRLVQSAESFGSIDQPMDWVLRNAASG